MKENSMMARIDVKEGTDPDAIRKGFQMSFAKNHAVIQGVYDDGEWHEKEKKPKEKKAKGEKAEEKKTKGK